MSDQAPPEGPDDGTAKAEKRETDLGFGSVVTQSSRLRFLNRDGSFNVRRRGLHLLPSLSPYYTLLSMSWTSFFLLLAVAYLAVNLLFALLYLAAGPEAVTGGVATTAGGRLVEDLFFSVQTLSTVGFGRLLPGTILANALVTLEAGSGLLVFAMAAGVVFAKISRPTTDIVFSRSAVIAPYRGGWAFMFRIANERRNQIIDLSARVSLAMYDDGDGRVQRRFHTLELERDDVAFFPLAWTVVHPITASSPLWGVDVDELARRDAEFVVLLRGTDDTFSQVVHARSSYKPSEIVWHARFSSVYVPDTDGRIAIDVRRLHAVEPVAFDAEAAR